MKQVSRVCLLLAVSGGVLNCARGQESKIQRGLSDLATREAVKLLSGKSLPLDAPPFSGKVEAVDPGANVKAAVQNAQVANDIARVKLTVSGKFRLDGKLNGCGAPLPVKATATVDITVEAKGDLRCRGGKLVIKPVVTDLGLKVIRVENLAPKDLAGGGAKMTDALNSGFARNKKDILEVLNATLKEQELP